ncbi:MAG: HEAT repeat domain-containing protein [Clostridia bacterium]|nr:HEAT repeat domain-containing protein [Clostridia bacterium]
MPVINFDEHFAAFTSEWMKEHRQEYRTFDDMEEDVPRIYMAFLNTRASWLGSVTPGSYFTQFEDPKVLVDWMNQYCDEGVPIPEPLLEQIAFVGKPCEKRLVELLKDEEATDEAKMTAVGLLRDLDSVQPKMLYINWQLERKAEDDLKDNAVESLIGMGESVVQPILQQFGKANEAGKEALLEVLSHFSGNEQILRLMLDAFQTHPEKRALFAGYLAKLGDERALPALTEAAALPNVPYLTYIEIRNAIETLGGECPEREYDDDPEYEALRGLDQT